MGAVSSCGSSGHHQKRPRKLAPARNDWQTPGMLAGRSEKANNTTAGSPPHTGGRFLIFFVCLFGILCLLFHLSFVPRYVVASNDGPLGFFSARLNQPPSSFFSVWADLNWLGINAGAFVAIISRTFLWLLGAVGYSKFYAALTVLILGVSAWVFFRVLKLHWLACLLGGLAAALNSDMFAAACWGVETQTACFGMFYLALAALCLAPRRWPWLRFLVAGLAVGVGITEGFDIGAIFSVCFAAYALYSALVSEGPLVRRLGNGFGGVAVIALFAAVVAAQALVGLISTQIQGVVGTKQDAETKRAHWDQATQWSLPKREILGVVVPGLFGFRMEASQLGLRGGDYWGGAGRDASWERYLENPQANLPHGGLVRHSGGGVYAGVLVVLIAVWAGAQSLRKKGSVFPLESRKLIWFWLGLMLLSALLAFGRHAPFYQFFYALPYSSTIRNPAKFMHVFSWALAVVFAYGVHGLAQRYLEPGPPPKEPLLKHLRVWWTKVSGFDRTWARGCLVAIGLSVVGWLVYAASETTLESYLQTVQFDTESAKAIAGFSLGQVGRYILCLLLAVGLMAAILSGWLSGPRKKWAAALLGLLLVADLGFADRPWIVYWDYPEKYATNPILDVLRDKPYEHRVAVLPFRSPPELDFFNYYYGTEWKQHQFPYYNIQTLDIVQMPRVPEEVAAFEGAFQPRSEAEVAQRIARRWQLTNTRYLLGAAGFLGALNQQIDPVRQRFRIAERFNIVQPGSPGLEAAKMEKWTAAPATNGAFALFEFTGALPRASLYSNWQVSTNDQATLETLASAGFDPAQTVLVAQPLAPPAANPPGQPPGTVEYTAYAPKRILLRAKAKVPAVLLLDDKFDPNWKVWVDGKPAAVLRCNYAVRGVQVPPGEHEIEFRFALPLTSVYLTLAGLALGLASLGCVLALGRPRIASPTPVPAAVAK